MAVHYILGKCCERNPEKAFAYMSQASMSGLPFSLCCLGLMYHYGVGVKRDSYAAFDCYRKAARRGDKEAEFKMWLMELHKSNQKCRKCSKCRSK